jgi:hypothetical protein
MLRCKSIKILLYNTVINVKRKEDEEKILDDMGSVPIVMDDDRMC